MALDSDAARAGFKIYMIFTGLLVSVLLTISTTWIGQLNSRADSLSTKAEFAASVNARQDQDMIKRQAVIDYNAHRIDALERTSDAMMSALQLMTTQITRLNDRVESDDNARTARKGP